MKQTKQTKQKESNKKYVVMLPIILSCVVLVASWFSSKSEDSSYVSESNETSHVMIDWEKVNSAIEHYDFASKGYWLESEYKETQEEFNVVMVTNYDGSKTEGFKEVEYQLLIAYGECSELNTIGAEAKTYDEAMIEISLLDNNGNGEYTVIYNINGEEVETFGEWFLPDGQEDYLKEVLNDSYEMFGL